jgi:YD repeat-containing protein
MKINKLFLFAAVAVLAFIIGACNQKQTESKEQDHVKYFRHIQFSETSWDIEKGTHPLTAKEAKTINNYKFTYNDNKQLVSVEYNRNAILLGYSSLGSAKISYTYQGDKQLKHYFDKNNEPTTQGKVFTNEYTVNDSGMRIAARFLDKEGNEVENRNNIHNYQWAKLDDGMIQEVRFNLAGENVIMNPFCPFYELRFMYDKNGFVTRMANYEADTLYNCTAENCGDIGVSYFLFVNNKHGDLKSFSVHNTVGQLSNLYWGWAKNIAVYDENGYSLEVTQFDQDDEILGGKNVPVTKTIYDQHGAITERISLDAEKNIINNPNNGVAIVAYKYDEQGRRVETLRYDKNRELVADKS